MRVAKQKIDDVKNLIDQCISGDEVSLKLFYSKFRNIEAFEIEGYVKEYEADKLYYHVHSLACQLYIKNPKLALKYLLENSKFFPPSYYRLGLHFENEQNYQSALFYFEKGWEKKHSFSGKRLSQYYKNKGISGQIRSVSLKCQLIYYLLRYGFEGEFSVRYIEREFPATI